MATTPLKIAQYGDIAAAIRKHLDTSGTSCSELADALGVHYSSVYSWMNCTSAPRPELRKKLAKALKVPESVLTPKEVATNQPQPRPAKVGKVLEFYVDESGMAHISMDITLPLEAGRKLLDAIMVASQQGGK